MPTSTFPDDPALNQLVEQAHLRVLGRQMQFAERMQLLLNNLVDPKLQQALGFHLCTDEYTGYFCSGSFMQRRIAISFGPMTGSFVLSSVNENNPREGQMISLPLRADEVQLTLLTIVRIHDEPVAIEKTLLKELGLGINE